ncbi:MAG: hypothetical protein COC19_05500 [SAR86 cluster bacterium]|uniref:DUF2306 domain-containing protein n=1 Tax=SAR86 cluster bacterium TaxID=2030880 RepID=A0A2A4MLL8_9GAMM|nr:MAG: hypothetical protein COC19_05500 [SAR86 cluster bacterium]
MTEISAELNQLPQRNYASLSLYALGTFLAVAVAGYGITFPLLLPNMPDEFHQRYLSMSQLLISIHVVGGGIALLISPIQLMIYRKNRTLHRYLGRVYFFVIMFASVGGYYMAWYAFGGIISTLGLGLLSTLWWCFTLLAVIYARSGNIAAHRRWMIRSFALTYAAVTLRLMSPVLSLLFDDITQSQIVYWLSWLTNLALAQCWINWHERRVSKG